MSHTNIPPYAILNASKFKARQITSVYVKYGIYSNARQGFSFKLGNKIRGGHLKFMYEELNQTTPNWITLNRTMQSQT